MSNGDIGNTGWEPGDTGGTDSLRDYIWQPFISPETNFGGTLRGSLEKGQMYFSLVNDEGKRQALRPGMTLLNPATREMFAIGQNFAITGSSKASEFDLERFGLMPSGDGTTGSTRVQFESERALDDAQARLANANAELARLEAQGALPMSPYQKASLEFQREQLALDKLRAENDLKEALYGQIGAATQTAFQAQEAERGRQQEMAGEDPFRFTATLRGRGTAGQTPVDVFKQQGAAFANQPLPQFSIKDPVPTLEAGLQGLQKMAIAGAPQGLIPGMAQGGVIEMKQKNGAFNMRPKQSFIVGEEGPEVLTVGDGRVEVTPFGGGAAGGLSFGNLDLGGFPDLLSHLRRSTGVGGSLATPGIRGRTVSVGDILQRGQASQLGAFQRPVGSLLQERGRGPVFVVDESGAIRPFTSGGVFRESGFDFGDVQPVTAGQLGRFERGAAISSQFSLPPPSYESEFGAIGQPLSTRRGFLELAAVNPSFSRQDAINLSNQIGFLPAPHKIAREFSLLDPTEQAGVISLYELAGFPTESLERIIGAATPTAGAFGGRRIGFTGGYMG